MGFCNNPFHFLLTRVLQPLTIRGMILQTYIDVAANDVLPISSVHCPSFQLDRRNLCSFDHPSWQLRIIPMIILPLTGKSSSLSSGIEWNDMTRVLNTACRFGVMNPQQPLCMWPIKPLFLKMSRHKEKQEDWGQCDPLPSITRKGHVACVPWDFRKGRILIALRCFFPIPSGNLT